MWPRTELEMSTRIDRLSHEASRFATVDGDALRPAGRLAPSANPLARLSAWLRRALSREGRSAPRVPVSTRQPAA